MQVDSTSGWLTVADQQKLNHNRQSKLTVYVAVVEQEPSLETRLGVSSGRVRVDIHFDPVGFLFSIKTDHRTHCCTPLVQIDKNVKIKWCTVNKNDRNSQKEPFFQKKLFTAHQLRFILMKKNILKIDKRERNDNQEKEMTDNSRKK